MCWLILALIFRLQPLHLNLKCFCLVLHSGYIPQIHTVDPSVSSLKSEGFSKKLDNISGSEDGDKVGSNSLDGLALSKNKGAEPSKGPVVCLY